ncbi:MAG: (d)CMP kinase, partial [Erythrobacter sp.]|nr:(d)CMP kinase [Erythrobacter sp.]
GGAVLDGRDIGTVIAPEAEVKLFVTASTAARAERRYAEMRESGRQVSLPAIVADLEMRDERDRNRAQAPLVVAPGAFVLDTTDLSRDDAVAQAVAVVVQVTGQTPCP